MADKKVSELVAASSVTPNDFFVLEQNGTAKKLTGQTLENWLVSFADGHGGIQSVEKIQTDILNDTYRITLADETTFDFVVTNGKGISSIEKTDTSGLTDTYTITYTDGTSSTYKVKNGEKGDKGDTAYIWIKYASEKPTENSNSFGDVPDEWIGVYFGFSSEAPTDWEAYSWYKIKGEQGDTGEAAALISSKVTYQVGDSGTVVPSGNWNANVPTVAQGKFLWTRVVQQFNTGDPITFYSVARAGVDGLGSVVTVAGISPDSYGNVALTAANVNALSTSGGTMEGSINMNGQTITGLNAPTDDTEAATKGYALDLMKQAVAHNFVDNGNFANPINQDGQTSYKGAVNGLDRWKMTVSQWMVSVVDGGIKVSGNPDDGTTKVGMLRQYIEVDAGMRGKTVTLAAKIKGNGVVRLNINNTAIGGYTASDENGESYGNDVWHIKTVTGVIPEDADTFYIALQSRNPTTSEYMCEWIALYEGAYTEETLPTYVAKDYAVELVSCLRHYVNDPNARFRSYIQSEGGLYNVQITFPVPMRITPTVTYDFSSGSSVYGTNGSAYVFNIYSQEPIILKNVVADARME